MATATFHFCSTLVLVPNAARSRPYFDLNLNTTIETARGEHLDEAIVE